MSETCRVSFRNKFEKLVNLVGFIVRICHDAWSHEHKKKVQYVYRAHVSSVGIFPVCILLHYTFSVMPTLCLSAWETGKKKLITQFVHFLTLALDHMCYACILVFMKPSFVPFYVIYLNYMPYLLMYF